jgi:hypothetical protein
MLQRAKLPTLSLKQHRRRIQAAELNATGLVLELVVIFQKSVIEILNHPVPSCSCLLFTCIVLTS